MVISFGIRETLIVVDISSMVRLLLVVRITTIVDFWVRHQTKGPIDLIVISPKMVWPTIIVVDFVTGIYRSQVIKKQDLFVCTTKQRMNSSTDYDSPQIIKRIGILIAKKNFSWSWGASPMKISLYGDLIDVSRTIYVSKTTRITIIVVPSNFGNIGIDNQPIKRVFSQQKEKISSEILVLVLVIFSRVRTLIPRSLVVSQVALVVDGKGQILVLLSIELVDQPNYDWTQNQTKSWQQNLFSVAIVNKPFCSTTWPKLVVIVGQPRLGIFSNYATIIKNQTCMIKKTYCFSNRDALAPKLSSRKTLPS